MKEYKEYVEANENAFDKLADQYYKRMKNPLQDEYTPEAIVNDIFYEYNKQYQRDPAKVLELGPGAGGVIRTFADKGCSTYAIDISEKMINYAKTVSPNTVFIKDDILSCENIFKQKFDIIYAGAIIHLFSLHDEQVILCKLKQWLTENGVLFMNTTLHDKSEEGFLVKEDYNGKIKRYRRKWERNELLEFLDRLGYQVVREILKDEKERNKTWINLFLIPKG